MIQGRGDVLSLYLGACMSLRCTMRESFQIVPGHGAQQIRSPWHPGVDEEEPEKGKQEREERRGKEEQRSKKRGREAACLALAGKLKTQGVSTSSPRSGSLRCVPCQRCSVTKPLSLSPVCMEECPDCLLHVPLMQRKDFLQTPENQFSKPRSPQDQQRNFFNMQSSPVALGR